MSVSGAGPSSSGPFALGALRYLGNDAPTPVALAFRFYLCSVSTSQLLPAPLSMVRNRDPLGQSPGEGHHPGPTRVPVDSPALRDTLATPPQGLVAHPSLTGLSGRAMEEKVVAILGPWVPGAGGTSSR